MSGARHTPKGAPHRRWWWAWAAAMLFGCTQANLIQGRIDGLQEVVKTASDSGASVCAPQELALAESHLAFAAMELAQGDQSRATEHLVVADANARAAVRLSPRERCVPRDVVVAPPPPKPGDRDGDGLLDPDDKCPDEPEDFDAFEDADGCPEDQDTDGDGLNDSVDLCIGDPEDTDGYLDTDGCPEPDNDADGMNDDADGCPDSPEDPDGFQDEDGCPDDDNDADGVPDAQDECPNETGPPSEKGCPKVYKNVVVTDTHIKITQKVHFETAKAVIRPDSYGLLSTVAQVLRDYPNIRVEVQGHTDSRGSDSYNLRLSEERAAAVREYLISQGIAPNRMTSRGYGEERPIEANRTRSGRAANRRVEFVRSETPSAAPSPNTP